MMAQSARDFIRMGNKAYREKQYDKAETMYLKSIAKDPTFEGYYNLGNAYVMQMKDSTAFENYKKADSIGTNDPLRKARNFHNMAVEFYKSSLRCNPEDDETRYNLAMAQHQLKKNQDQQNQNGGGGNDDKNKDKQDQDKQQQKQDQQKQDQQKKDEDKQQQQQQPQPEQKKDEMSDQAAEQLLNSAQQDEKGVQRKVNKHQNNRRRSLEKDW